MHGQENIKIYEELHTSRVPPRTP